MKIEKRLLQKIIQSEQIFGPGGIDTEVRLDTGFVLNRRTGRSLSEASRAQIRRKVCAWKKSETHLSRNMMPGCTKKYSSYDTYTGNTCTVRKNIQPGI